MNLIAVLELEDMGFMFGKSCAEPSLKLHLLRLEMQPLYQDVKICDLALSSCQQSVGQCLNYSYIVIIQFFSMIYCIGSRCRRVAVLNRKVSNAPAIAVPIISRLTILDVVLASAGIESLWVFVLILCAKFSNFTASKIHV
jgi:hypothetical protein